MALDTLAQTLLLMRVDNSQAIAAMAKMTGAEREAAKAAVEAQDKRNKSLQSWAEGLTKINVALGTVTKAVQFGADAWKVYEEQQRLAAASASYDIGRLRQASSGLRSDMELLKVAAGAANTTYKLTQEQLETALVAMRSFEQQGNDIATVQAAVGKAIAEGTIEPLKQFGVVLKPASSEAEKFNQLMQVLAENAELVEGKQLNQNEAFRKAGVEYTNAMNRLKAGIGELVVSLQPLVSALGTVVGMVAKLVEMLPAEVILAIAGAGAYAYGKRRGGAAGRIAQSIPFLGSAVIAGTELGNWLADDTDFLGQHDLTGVYRTNRLNDLNAANAATGQRLAADYDALDLRLANAQVASMLRNIGMLERVLGVERGGPKPRRGGGGSGRGRAPRYYIEAENTGELIPVFQDETLNLGRTIGSSLASQAAGAGVRLDLAGAGDALSGLQQQLAIAGQFYGERKSFLQSVFGDFGEFDAYAEQIRMLGDAVGVFSGALSSSFNSWISGSASAKQALKALFADTITGIASSMFARALEHGAMAVGALAYGDLRGAATHGKAAALNAAGAIAVGALARQLNAGAAAPALSAGGAAGAPALTSGGAGGSTGGHTTVILGDSMADDSPRWRQRETARAIRRARRYLDDGRGVEYR